MKTLSLKKANGTLEFCLQWLYFRKLPEYLDAVGVNALI